MTRRGTSTAFAFVLGCWVSSSAAEPFACPSPKTPKERDRVSVELFNRAIQKEAADPDGALELLRCADGLADRPAVALRRGLTAERVGKNDEAIVALERYLALAGDYAPDKQEMQRHIARLKSAREKPEDPEDEPVPVVPADPEPGPSPKTSTKKTAGIVTLGVGGALVVVGTVLLYSAKKKSDAVHDVDPSSRTPWQSADGEERLDAAKKQQTWGFIALGVGALGAAAGAYLIVDTSEKSAFLGVQRAF